MINKFKLFCHEMECAVSNSIDCKKKTALVLHFAEAHVLPLCWNSFKLSAVSLKARFWVGSWQPLHPSIWEHWQQFLAAAWQRQAKTPAF